MISPLRILLVEDNLVNQQLALTILENAGHHVVLAENGREALEKLESESVDVVLMDVEMPEMDGLEATRRLRAGEQESGRHVPVVAMTAHAIKGDRERCLEAGMDDYLSKPIQPRTLHEKLAQFAPAEKQTDRQPAEQPAEQPVEQSDKQTATSKATPGDDHPEDNPTAVVESNTSTSDKPSATDDEVELDWQGAIERYNLSEEGLRRIVETFLKDCPQLLAQIQTAISEGDSTTLHRAAHTLKGSADIFSAKQVVELALELEMKGREKNVDGADQIHQELQRRAEKLMAALREAMHHDEAAHHAAPED